MPSRFISPVAPTPAATFTSGAIALIPTAHSFLIALAASVAQRPFWLVLCAFDEPHLPPCPFLAVKNGWGEDAYPIDSTEIEILSRQGPVALPCEDSRPGSILVDKAGAGFIFVDARADAAYRAAYFSLDNGVAGPPPPSARPYGNWRMTWRKSQDDAVELFRFSAV